MAVEREDLTGKPWTREEVQAAVDDYFHMLRLELLGQAYNKSAHRRELQRKLRGRSEGSIEMKHQNISAALISLGAMPLRGYPGLPNFQEMVLEVVAERLGKDDALDRAAIEAVARPAEPVIGADFSKFLVQWTPGRVAVKQDGREWNERRAVHRDYLEREARNRTLGQAGEVLVLEFESHKLHALGLKRLAGKIEHVSKSKGDGLGYDVLSFEPDGRERFIEVKTTSFAETTPFFVSKNEVEFSRECAEQFHLYRVFDFRRQPRMFQLPGPVDASCILDPVNFRARPI